MQVGVVLLRSVTASPNDLTSLAQTIERLGFHSIWVTEHIAIPVEIRSRYPYSEDGRPSFGPETEWPEAMVALGYVAAVTRRVRLGTAVIPMITRDPVSMAKQAATVDALSDGRLELGLGAGWLLEEAEVLGHPHDRRGDRLDEAIDIMRKAWTESTFSHEGRFWRIPPVGVHPHPPQGAELPIWIGGTRPAAIRTSAERAAGNLLWMPTPAEVAQMRAALSAGRRVAASMPFWYGRGDPAPRARALGDAGADLVLLVHYGEPPDVARDLERFASESLAAL
jgi:probable F420-dependent oxidoreductase